MLRIAEYQINFDKQKLSLKVIEKHKKIEDCFSSDFEMIEGKNYCIFEKRKLYAGHFLVTIIDTILPWKDRAKDTTSVIREYSSFKWSIKIKKRKEKGYGMD